MLTSGRASPLSPNTILPVAPGQTSPGVPPPYYPSTYDTTIDDILGSSNYYTDREQYRRYSLVSSAVNTYNAVTSAGRGSGVYLAGWTSRAPVSASVLNTAYKTLDQTVYLIALRSALDFGGGSITVPPGMMTWTPLSTAQTSGAASPYDSTLYAGDQLAVRFSPIQPVAFRRVQELLLRLAGTSYGSSSSFNVAPEVELWDFARNGWVRLEGVSYGDRPVEDAERFVGAGGEVRVRLTNASNDTINLTSAEFALTVEP
jgi:hypothetical protein